MYSCHKPFNSLDNGSSVATGCPTCKMHQSALSYNSQYVCSVATREGKIIPWKTRNETEKNTDFLLYIKALVVAHATNPLGVFLELLERSLTLCW